MRSNQKSCAAVPARCSAPEHDPCVTSEHSTTARRKKLGVNFVKGGKPECPEKIAQRKIDIGKSQPTYELSM